MRARPRRRARRRRGARRRARARGRGGGAGGRADRRREHGERDPAGRRRARPRPARLRADRLRRRRARCTAARWPSGSSIDDGAGPAAPRALLGVRRGDRAGRASTACRRVYARSDAVDLDGARRAPSDAARGRGRRSCGGASTASEPIVRALGRPALRGPELRARGRAAGRRPRRRPLGRAARRFDADARAAVRLRARRARRSSSINLRVTALQPGAAASRSRRAATGPRSRDAATVWFDADGPRRVRRSYRRASLAPGDRARRARR